MDALNRISLPYRLQASRSPLGRALVEAVATLLAAIITLLCVLALSPEPGSGVLAVVLCLSLSRSQLDRDRRGRIEAAFVLPVVGLLTAGIGLLLHRFPVVGALVFTAGMFVSIWLRRFGPMARRVGSLIALPFVTLLTAPYLPPRHPGLVPAVLLPIIIALLALFWVNVVHALAQALRLLAPMAPPTPIISASAPPAANAWRPIASTRMAIQMAVALALSFAMGYAVFPQHWAWVVLTAFIVNSGNRGRLDVVHKSVLRVLGAAAGTVIAGVIGHHLGIDRHTMVILIWVAVFLGLWLRPISYAWWALFVTVVLALLQIFMGEPASGMLWSRLEEIATGAILGVGAAWFVLPVRSTDVLRRRIAEALAALAGALDRQQPTHQAEALYTALHAIEHIAPAFRASRHVARHLGREQAVEWIDVLLGCREPAAKLIERGGAPASVYQALGQARRSLREPETMLAALQELQARLQQACAEQKAQGAA